MEKIRVYELAKELNTSSTRLKELLKNDFGIEVKGHMSHLEEPQLKKIYDFYGINKQPSEKKEEEKKPQNIVKVEKKDKNAPRIIRKTQINLDLEEPGAKKDIQSSNEKGNPRYSVSTASSGLMTGMVRDNTNERKKTSAGNKKVEINDLDNGKGDNGKADTGNADNNKADNTDKKLNHEISEVKVQEVNVNNVVATNKNVPEVKVVETKAVEDNAASTNSSTVRTSSKDVSHNKVESENTENLKFTSVDKSNEAEKTVTPVVEMTQGENAEHKPKPNNSHSEANSNENGTRNHGGQHSGNYNRDRAAGGQGNGNYGNRDRAAGGQGGGNYGNRDRAAGGQGGGNYNRDRASGGQGGGNYNRDRAAGGQGGGNYNRDRAAGGQGGGNYNRDRAAGGQGGGNYGNRDRAVGAQGGQGGDRSGNRPPFERRPYNNNGPRTGGTGGTGGQGGDRSGNRPPFERRPFNNDNGARSGGAGGRFQGRRDGQDGDNRQGGRPPYNGGRGDRQGGGGGLPPIPKVEATTVTQKPDSKRDYLSRDPNRDAEKMAKKELRKEAVKPAADKGRNINAKNFIGAEKKGISEAVSEEYILREFYETDGKFKKSKSKGKARFKEQPPAPKPVINSIKLSGSVTVKDLAEAMTKTATDVIKKLMGMGVMATVNQELDYDTAAIIAEEMGVKVEKEIIVSEEDRLFDDADDNDEELQARAPVVVVMGHVDHGKTSLLDAIRQTNVIEGEAGGITQHIGAYMVKINGRNITFLDTPGHEAFTAMRARGAQVTDIAIIVVAADDGVMPQTIEAINHAKAANVSIIVAINKIDKPGANPDRVKQELAQHGVVVEEWGGDTISVPVSAKHRTNIDNLLEMVLLTADIAELKANPNKQAKGTVIEARLDKDRGSVATILVQRGTLKLGDSIVTGTTVGRIRAMNDDKGHKVKKAGPSTPVEILGLPEVPEAGEIFYAIEDEKMAKQLAEKRRLKIREHQINSSTRVTLEDLFNQIKSGKVKDLNIIVKADVQGSVEAVKQSLTKLSNEEVRVNIIHGAVGTINESDVTFAQVSNAIIIGFNVRPPANVVEAAKATGVDIRLYRIIYNAIEDIEAAMKGMLDPTYKEVVHGHIEVRQTFKASGIGTIGGGYVIDGKVGRNNEVRVVRDGVVIHENKFGSLKRFKDDAKEVNHGFECGFTVEKFNDLQVGDIIECFEMEEVKR